MLRHMDVSSILQCKCNSDVSVATEESRGRSCMALPMGGKKRVVP